MIAFEISMGCSGGSRGLLQNSSNEKNEIDFPERGYLSHFVVS